MSRLTSGDTLRLHGLHWLARAALRAGRPLRAKALVDRVGRRFPLRGGVEVARAAVRELLPAGSCLSRALVIAATLPGAGLLILPNVSHFAFLQDPAMFNYALLHFLGDA